jgi:hypothetical protein
MDTDNTKEMIDTLFEPENPFLVSEPSIDPDALLPIPNLVVSSDSENEDWARTPTRHSPHISTGNELFENHAMKADTKAVKNFDEYKELIEACRKRNAGIPLDDPALEPLVDEFQDILREHMHEAPEWKIDDGNESA